MMLPIIGISVAPLVLVSTFILYEFHGTFEEKLTAHLLETVEKHKQHIDAFLRAKLEQIRILSKSFSYEELRSSGFLSEHLAILQQEQDPVLVDLGVVSTDGSQVAYAGPFILGQADYSGAAWFREASRREYFISDVFAGLRGLPHFIIAVRSHCDGQSWILRATIDFVAFKNLVENIRIGETGLAYILNRDGQFQVGPTGDSPLRDSIFGQLLDSGSSESGQARVILGRDASGRSNIYVAASLNEGNWLLVYQQNSSDAFSAFWKAVKIALLIIVLASLAIVTTAYLMKQRVVSRIARVDREKKIMGAQIVETGKLAAVGELAAGIAHEINNPVAIMVEEAGWIEDLLEEEDLSGAQNIAEFRRALNQIRNQGSRCKQITQKLLSFARKTDPRKHLLRLKELVDELIALSAQRARYASVELKTAIAPNLPGILGSQTELQQVFLNLINNALDAMEKAGGSLEITARQEQDKIIVCVADTGPGIPQAILERIFDPFFTTKPVGKGTGLGLSICYGIIHQMGGAIQARSVVGAGTTFRIEFPIAGQAASTRAVEPATQPAGSNP